MRRFHGFGSGRACFCSGVHRHGGDREPKGTSMGRVRASWIAGGAFITLCACSGSIEPSGFKVPGQSPNQATPWSPGDPNVPGAPGTPGAPGRPGAPGQPGVGGTGALPGAGTGAAGTGATIPPTGALTCVTPAVGP